MFIVEDGTKVPNANAYASVAYVDSYFTDRNNSSWTGSETEKKAAIILATDYIESFKNQFKDVSEGGSLFYPAVTVGMPTPLLQATAEYSLRALLESLETDALTDSSGMQLSESEKVVGPISTKKKFFQSAVNPLSRFPSADKYLKQLLRSSNTIIRN